MFFIYLYYKLSCNISNGTSYLERGVSVRASVLDLAVVEIFPLPVAQPHPRVLVHPHVQEEHRQVVQAEAELVVPVPFDYSRVLRSEVADVDGVRYSDARVLRELYDIGSYVDPVLVDLVARQNPHQILAQARVVDVEEEAQEHPLAALALDLLIHVPPRQVCERTELFHREAELKQSRLPNVFRALLEENSPLHVETQLGHCRF
mmetsp:Transcript_2960/g.8001  ORF Transcript_2960/g.8001 Transcript_2960/m.8001 type:complete len:205 (-) Transcript_2960:3167-3781(-)